MGSFGFPDASVAEDLVTARFGLSTDLVNQYDSASTSALGALGNASFSAPSGSVDISDLPPEPPIGEPPSPDAVAAYVSKMTAVTFSDIAALRNLLGLTEATIAEITLPVLTAVEPTVNIPAMPSTAIPTVPSDAPAVADPAIPPAPSLDLPPVPVLETIALPAAPVLEGLSFDGVMPTADLTPPEPMFVYSEATYQSDLADALRTKLYNDITLGNAVYTDEVWTAIWERALTQLDIEINRGTAKILNTWEQWNMEMPDGVLSAALQEALYDDRRTRLDLARDTMYKQADVTQQATQFAITSGLTFEKQIMDFTNQVNQRAFEIAKTQVQMVIDIFQLRVSAYTARLEGYKTLAQVFESRIRAELARVEIYRAQMEGAKILGDLQVQQVEIYSKRVQALQVVIDLYRAQMEGAKLQVEIDKARIEAFRARIDAAVAQINGGTAGFNLYQAQIAGETAKVDLFAKQVEAFSAQMQGAKVASEINIAEIQAVTEGNKDRIAVLTAAIEKYKADTDYQLGLEEAGTKVYAADIGAYEAEVGRESEYIKALVNRYSATISGVMAQAEIAVKELEANLRAMTAMKEVQVEALKAAALIQAQKVASALSSVSASAQLGFNESLSNSYSESDSDSNVTSDSNETGEKTLHNYNYNM